MTPIRKTLIDIQETHSFDRLEPFKQASVWKSFASEERVLLARLLVLQGAQQLAKGDQQVLESFEIASQVSSYSPEILYQQGKILSSYHDNIRCLTLASQALIKALQQDPALFKAWYLRAQVLIKIGSFEEEASYFIEAQQNFERAEALLETLEEVFHREEFYWHWGLCFAFLGRISGEPLDFHQAIKKYQLSYQLGNVKTHFFNDFGNSYSELASLLEKPDYFHEALQLFNQAVQQNSDDFDGWYNQACCLQVLTDYVHHDRFLEQAEQSFAKAAEINPQHSQVWFKWAQFETIIGKIKHDQQKLESSLIKFAQAYQLEPSQPGVLNSWAETELFVGVQEEKLDLIHSARAKILNSLQIQPEDVNTWYLYGCCLNELGRYFSDEDYYNQAIEKFQYGLSLTRRHPLLWYGLALSYYALGELTEEQALVEKAVRYCARVIECGGGGFAQFWNDWGIALMKLAELTQQASHVEMAIEKFEKAFKHPVLNMESEDVDLEWVYNYGTAFDLLGDLTEEAGHFEKAVRILTQVLQLDPEYNQARYNLALALSHLGEAMYDVEPYYKAIEHFQYLLHQDPEDDMVHLDFGMSVTNLGLLVHDIHHPERSQTLYRQAENHLMQAASLGNTQAYYQLAGLYSITKHYNQAMHYLERAQFFNTLPGMDDLLHDEWLEGLRQTPAFRQFITALSGHQSLDDK